MRNHCSNSHGVIGRSPGGRPQYRSRMTACPNLMIVPCSRTATATRQDEGEFWLVHTPSGRRIPVCGTPGALAELARQLAWFAEVLDPAFLASPVNAGVRDSLRELLRAWLAETVERDSVARPRIDTAMHPRALWDVTA